MQKTVSRLLGKDSGATAIEYALIASLISIAIVGALIVIGQSLSGIFTTVSTSL